MGFFDLFKGEQPPLVRDALRHVEEMLKQGYEMFEAATAYLLDNEILDVDLKALDENVNRREQELRRLVLQHLTVDPNRELLFSLKLISIVHEAERIGDLAKSIAKTAALADRPRLADPVLPLRALRDRIRTMFEQARAGFVKGDEAVARALMREHEQIKDEVSRYLQALAANEALTPNEAVVYALGARLLSRVSSHLANIASTVAQPFDRIRRAASWAEGD